MSCWQLTSPVPAIIFRSHTKNYIKMCQVSTAGWQVWHDTPWNSPIWAGFYVFFIYLFLWHWCLPDLLWNCDLAAPGQIKTPITTNISRMCPFIDRHTSPTSIGHLPFWYYWFILIHQRNTHKLESETCQNYHNLFHFFIIIFTVSLPSRGTETKKKKIKYLVSNTKVIHNSWLISKIW